MSNLDVLAEKQRALAAEANAAPELVIPPAATWGPAVAGAWYTANAATFLRFQQAAPKVYRWINLRVGVQSGNCQVGVVRLVRSGTTVTTQKVIDSGVIATPAAGDNRIDCGATLLPAGDYALFLWCDNITATFLHAASSGLTASRACFTATGLATGITAAAITLSTTTRYVSGLSLETDS